LTPVSRLLMPLCSVLQCVLQRVAACCSVLQCCCVLTVTRLLMPLCYHCSILQCVAVCCSVLASDTCVLTCYRTTALPSLSPIFLKKTIGRKSPRCWVNLMLRSRGGRREGEEDRREWGERTSERSRWDIIAATHCNTLDRTWSHCNTLQHTATHCNALQRTATHCNALQRTATHCSTLQHTV